jgi:hypothetical protein
VQVTVSSRLKLDADTVWDAAKRSKTLGYVLRGLLHYRTPMSLPRVWRAGQTVRLRFYLLGMIPWLSQTIHLIRVDERRREIWTEAASEVLVHWRHVLKVEAIDEQRCRVTDRIDFHAAGLTLPVWFAAHLLYRHRHRRWKRLVRQIRRARRRGEQSPLNTPVAERTN